MMYLISYQIRPNGRTIQSAISATEAVEDEIVEFGQWWHYLRSVWIVDTEMTVDQMTKAIVKHLHPKDDLLIIGIHAPYQGWLPEDAWEWLDQRSKKQELTASR